MNTVNSTAVPLLYLLVDTFHRKTGWRLCSRAAVWSYTCNMCSSSPHDAPTALSVEITSSACTVFKRKIRLTLHTVLVDNQKTLLTIMVPSSLKFSFAFENFWFCLHFFSNTVKLPIWTHAKWLSVPQRDLWLQLPICQQCPPACLCKEGKKTCSLYPLCASCNPNVFLTCRASLRAHWDCSDAPAVSQPVNNPEHPLL